MLKNGTQSIPAILLLSAVLLAATPALAARGPGETPAHAVAARAVGESLATRAWLWVQSLFAEEGACIDPNGGCLNNATTPTSTPQLDRGACIDPNGGCLAATVFVRP